MGGRDLGFGGGMDGIHDLGGMHGFGHIDRDDPPLEAWEAAVIAIQGATRRAGLINIDEFRHGIERMEPGHYLTSPYFEHWLDGIARILAEKNLVDPDELESRIAFFDEHPEATAREAMTAAPAPPRELPRVHLGTSRAPTVAAKFAEGDAIRTRLTHVPGHTRLPRYARGKRGRIHLVHGVHVYPDTNAHLQGEDPTWVYSVRFDPVELWPDDYEDRTVVYLDAFEPYLVAERSGLSGA